MDIIERILDLQNSPIRKIIEKRLNEFRLVGDSDLFGELCFCLMTANFRASKCIEIQERIGRGFHTWDEERLATELKSMGHRFWPQRAKRIVLARGIKTELLGIRDMNSNEARDFLVENVLGLGLKESSHFLRNIGVLDVSIIDFHIVDLLVREGLIGELPSKSISSSRYIEIEDILKGLGNKLSMNLAEIDLYLWYIETGNILK
ncbi:MAG: N-glycosylase/DNA lyase [Nanoarchaeota archaeon]|nr:N-glycosylase/DNA lyase [Nanoarchaeota archaeon]